MADDQSLGGAFGEIGVSGLVHSRGTISEEWLPELKGRSGQAIYRQMIDNDPIIGAILYAIEMTLRAVPWSVQVGGEGTPEDQERAKFLESCMDDMSMSWVDFISAAESKVPYGWAYFESVYKRREGPNGEHRSKHSDGKVGWRKFALRSQDTLDRWEIDSAGGIIGMWQRTSQLGESVPIPIAKAVLYRTSIRKNNPEGRSLLRTAYTSWYRKDRVETGEMIGIERDLVGVMVVKLPPALVNSTKAEDVAAIDEWKEIVSNMRAGEQAGIVAPYFRDPETGNETISIELLKSPGTRLIDTGKIIQRYTQAMAMSTLQDVILLGHEQVGSLALADTKKALAQNALKAQVDEIASTLNAHEIPRLFRLNGWSTEDLPTVVPGEIGDRDLEKMADLIAATAGAGMGWFPDMSAENKIRTILGFDPIDDLLGADEEEFRPTPPTSKPDLSSDETQDDDDPNL